MQASSSTSSSEPKKPASGIAKFFRNAALLLACVIVLDQVGGWVLKKMYFSARTGPFAETTHVFTEVETEGMILGSSRGRRNYNPNLLADSLGITVYNAGHDGQTIFYEQAIVRMNLTRHSPKLVILDLNPEEMYYRDVHYDRLNVLAPYYADFPEVRSIYRLKGVRDRRGDGHDFWLKPAKEGKNLWENFWFHLHGFEEYVLPFNSETIKMWSAIYPYNSSLLDILSGIFKNRKSESGFKPLKGVITDEKAEELIQANAALRTAPGKKLDQNKLNGLEEIITSLNEAGCKVVVCMSPALAPFGMEPSYAAVEALCKKHGVPFKDYSQDPSYNRLNYFFDNHMNKDGANLFSSHLASDIRNNFFPGEFN
jgi:hypothetical protein